MTFEEAGLVSTDPVVTDILKSLVSRNVQTAELKAIKKILEEGAPNREDGRHGWADFSLSN